jgi:hypothetical protein
VGSGETRPTLHTPIVHRMVVPVPTTKSDVTSAASLSALEVRPAAAAIARDACCNADDIVSATSCTAGFSDGMIQGFSFKLKLEFNYSASKNLRNPPKTETDRGFEAHHRQGRPGMCDKDEDSECGQLQPSHNSAYVLPQMISK